MGRRVDTGARRWRPEPGGGVSAEALHLVVHPHTPGGYARSVVLRHRGGEGASGPAPLASGSEEDVAAAMRSAERMASSGAGTPGLARPRDRGWPG